MQVLVFAGSLPSSLPSSPCTNHTHIQSTQVYAEFLKEGSISDETAKSRLLALFKAIDLNGNGSLSRAELTEFVGKGLAVVTSMALLAVHFSG